MAEADNKPGVANSDTEDDQEDTGPSVNGPAKLTDWKNEPTLMQLKQHLEDSRELHNAQVNKIRTWLDNLHITGTAKMKPVEGSSSVQPKLIRKQAEWRYAALSEPFLSTDDVYNVSPVTWADRGAAQQNQLVLNHQFNTCFDKQTFIDEYVRTGVDEGTIIVKLGWDYKYETSKEKAPPVRYVLDPEFQPAIQAMMQMKVQDPRRYRDEVPDEMKEALRLTAEQGTPVRPEIIEDGEWEEVEKKKVLCNKPTIEICDYRNVVIDPMAKGKVDKARFIIHSFETDMATLKDDGRYKNLDKITPNQNSPLAEPDHAASLDGSNFNFADKPRTKFVAYEFSGFWDITGTGVVEPILATWVGNVLIRMEKLPFPDKKLNYVIVKYLPVRHSNYGEPDGSLLEDNQKILGAITRGMIDLMGKSANSQTGMRKDMLDAVNRRKFEKGLDYEFNGNIDPRVGTYTHTYPEIPQSALLMVQLMNQEAESLTGVRSFSQGVSGASLGDVAAGVRGALDAASKRELGILRRLSDGLIQIARKLIAMNAEWLSEEEVIRVTDEEFVLVKRDDLAGAFDLKLSISTAEEDEHKASELAFMLQTMGNTADRGLAKMILADIAKLRKMPDLAKRIESFQPEPDPVAQKLQELEIAKIEAEVAELRAKAQKTLAEAGLAEAKVATEGAKAANLNSDTDMKNLDFVEQESGVKQERDLQKQGAQAEAQGGLKLLEHYLDLRKPKSK